MRSNKGWVDLEIENSMANTKELDRARGLIAEGRHSEARKILETIKTQNLKVRLDVLLVFLVVLDDDK